jgi:hypothetical protein
LNFLDLLNDATRLFGAVEIDAVDYTHFEVQQLFECFRAGGRNRQIVRTGSANFIQITL